MFTEMVRRHKIVGCWCFALLVFPFVTLTVTAQNTCGGIKGGVTSPQGWLIPKATILLINRSSRQTIKVETDDTGEYTICLPAGMYDVVASAIGYKRAKRNSIQVDESSKATIDLVLTQNGTVMSDRVHP